MFLGCQSHILNRNQMCELRHNFLGILYYFFHIFTKSFALFLQIKFCNGRKFPMIGEIYARKNHG